MPTLEARGVELGWSESGHGAPVLLVHETATSSAIWSPVAGGLADSARAVAYDRRGWGSSSVPEGYRRTTIEEQSEDAAVLLESLGAGTAVVCGAGLGALIALDLIMRRPELVAGGVLVEPPLMALLPAATEALSDDRVALREAVADQGVEGAVDLYLSGALSALGPGTGRLPSALTAKARERPRILFAELGAPAAWSMPLPQLASAERPSVIVTAPSTPHLLQESAKALGARLAGGEQRELDEPRLPPHLGDPDGLAALALKLAAA